ncbi:transposase [Saccharothrix sp. BKS2]|uniref:transposase n=1 Tax=Saccharothrix sp. BKS2 TaxID=3064400 RepID=UPI0039EADEFC
MARKSGKYSPELRAEVVAAVIEGGRTYAEVARDFGLVAETVRNWVVTERKKNAGGGDEAAGAIDRARTAELERRVRELEQENAFLKKAAAFFAREQR